MAQYMPLIRSRKYICMMYTVNAVSRPSQAMARTAFGASVSGYLNARCASRSVVAMEPIYSSQAPRARYSKMVSVAAKNSRDG